eukprot:1145359-Pyramimonas_sp.AAC.1
MGHGTLEMGLVGADVALPDGHRLLVAHPDLLRHLVNRAQQALKIHHVALKIHHVALKIHH